MKKFFIIPGFKQKPTDISFKWINTFLVQKGYQVALVPITWERRTMADYCLEFENFYLRHKTNQDNYILGFSYGAVIAFITANNLKPKKIYLCSLSPDFKEDIPKTERWLLDYIGKNRVTEALTRSGKEIAKNLAIPAVIFYGEKEGKKYPQLKTRCTETARLATNAKLVMVKDTPHDISSPEYISAIKREIVQN